MGLCAAFDYAETDERKVMSHKGLSGALYRDLVVAYGMLYICEITKQTACEAVCDDIMARGGEIIRVDTGKRNTGKTRQQTVYTILFALPDGI